MPKGGRSYSDPSYGSHKQWSFQRVSMGTRAADTVELAAGIFTAVSPCLLKRWKIVCSATGNGGTSTWILKKGTLALGTLSFVTNPTAGTVVSGTLDVTNGTCAAGTVVYLYTGLSTADPAAFVTAALEYHELFTESDS